MYATLARAPQRSWRNWTARAGKTSPGRFVDVSSARKSRAVAPTAGRRCGARKRAPRAAQRGATRRIGERGLCGAVRRPESATAQLRIVLKRLEELARIDEERPRCWRRCSPPRSRWKRPPHALRHYLGKLEADPARLDEVKRAGALEKLKRKYGATIDEVLAFLEDVRAATDRGGNFQRAADRVCAKKSRNSAAAYEARPQRSSTAAQNAAAKRLAKTSKGAGVAGHGKRRAWRSASSPRPGPNTARIRSRFLISPNAGRGAQAARKDRLGRRTVARRAGAENLHRAAPRPKARSAHAGLRRSRRGRRRQRGGSGGHGSLKKLAVSSQVLCVTHLPQIAGFADHHYYVEKQTVKGRTMATIEELTPGPHARNRTNAFRRTRHARGVAARRAIDQVGRTA